MRYTDMEQDAKVSWCELTWLDFPSWFEALRLASCL
jgi:hypothetical protein